MAKVKDDEEKKSVSKGVVIFSILLALVLTVGIWGYLIKSNRFFGLGEFLRPHIKDTPVLCMLLPDLSDESDPDLFDRESLNARYTQYYNETQQLRQKVAELEQNAGDYAALESKYEIVLKEVESLTAALKKKEEEEVIIADTTEDES